MILFPGVLNVLYFWVADSYLKKKPETDEAGEIRRDSIVGGGGGERRLERRDDRSLHSTIATNWSEATANALYCLRTYLTTFHSLLRSRPSTRRFSHRRRGTNGTWDAGK